MNVLRFEVWVEFPTAAVNDDFVCDGEGGACQWL